MATVGAMFPGPMLKGILVALGIMLLLMLIPIVDFVGIPFGPFIGAYYGMASIRTSTGEAIPPGPPSSSQIGSFAIKGAIFGGILGLLISLILVIVGASLMVTIDLSDRFINDRDLVATALFTSALSDLAPMLRAPGRSLSIQFDDRKFRQYGR